jgi:2-keto-4-pentenoate hydratase
MSVELGTAAMLTRRREILAQGAEPIGWKIGFNVPDVQQKLGLDAPVAGFLTTDSLVEGDWSIEDDGQVIVESEVAVEIGDDARSIAAVLPALEIADPPDLDIDIEQIIAGDIFHRGVVFGPRVGGSDAGTGRILVNGEERHSVRADDLPGAVATVAGRLQAAGEELQPGDRIITGILAPPHTPEPGDTVRLELDGVGSVELHFS